jgi:hypothetical protein
VFNKKQLAQRCSIRRWVFLFLHQMIITPYTPNHIMACSEDLGRGDFAKLSALPGYFRWQERNAIIRATGSNIEHLLKHWPNAKWVGKAKTIRNDYINHKETSAQAAKTKTLPDKHFDDSDYEYKRPPMSHQIKAFVLSRDKKVFGLFMEQGTGKTKVILDNAQWLFKKKLIDLLIVVAFPNGVHRNWIDYELPLDVRIPYYAEYWSSHYKRKNRQKALKAFLEPSKKLKIFCFNVEAFVSPNAKAYILKLLKEHKTMLVIDQSASIKNPRAKRTKFLISKCSQQADYRRVLDGQPVAEGASELFSQFKFLDPWIIGHDTWTAFKAEFCRVGWFNEVIGYQNLDELHRRIDGHCFRVLEEECLDLPSRIYKMWSFNLNDEEQRVFDELRIQDITTFTSNSDSDEDQTLEEHNALVKNMRLQQISSGWWPKDKIKALTPQPSRAEALLNLLSEIGKEKALIYARFRADLAILAKLLGESAVSYHGGVSDEARRKNVKEFMTNPKIKYFLGQPRSAGFGLTLTAARHVIFYSNDHSLRLREECEKRAHRKGQTIHVHVWDLIARRTQDINIIRAFRAKKELANEILHDPDNFFLHHE